MWIIYLYNFSSVELKSLNFAGSRNNPPKGKILNLFINCSIKEIIFMTEGISSQSTFWEIVLWKKKILERDRTV